MELARKDKDSAKKDVVQNLLQQTQNNDLKQITKCYLAIDDL